MAECRKCNATITPVTTVDGVIPLDVHESATGEDRYVITDFETQPWTAERLDPLTSVSGHTDHRKTCPLA